MTQNRYLNYFVLAIILFGFIIYLFNSDLSKSNDQIPDLNEVSPDPETISIETQKEEYIEFADNLTESIGSAEKISDNEADSQLNDEASSMADDVVASTEPDSPPEVITFNSVEDFVCTVDTASLKSFSMQSPEKSSYYFYFISNDSQKICVADSLGALKEYDLKKGAKLSHHGSPQIGRASCRERV